jgi:hypothetical protein
MTLSVKKVGGNQLRFTYNDGLKTVAWMVESEDVSLDTLQDILGTVRGQILPTTPAIPTDYPRGWDSRGAGRPVGYPGLIEASGNLGAEAADKAARDEEVRLRNMGSALGQGVNMAADDIPVVDNDRNDMSEVNWGV